MSSKLLQLCSLCQAKKLIPNDDANCEREFVNHILAYFKKNTSSDYYSIIIIGNQMSFVDIKLPPSI